MIAFTTVDIFVSSFVIVPCRKYMAQSPISSQARGDHLVHDTRLFPGSMAHQSTHSLTSKSSLGPPLHFRLKSLRLLSATPKMAQLLFTLRCGDKYQRTLVHHSSLRRHRPRWFQEYPRWRILLLHLLHSMLRPRGSCTPTHMCPLRISSRDIHQSL